MTDVLLRHFADGGDIEYINGQATMSDGLETSAYLSLFGGNERDSGLEDGDTLQWWGNLAERDPSSIYRSQTQHLLRSIALVPSNLKRLEDAADADLAWYTDSGLATFAGAVVSLVGVNRVDYDVRIEIADESFEFSFSFSGETQ